MRFDLSADQDFFRETTAKFLEDQMPVGELRRLRDDPAGFEEKYWRQGAELGWTSLLISAEHGGGAISDDPLIDLSVIAYEFGRHAAPGPLVTTNLVAAALSGAAAGTDVLAELLSGAAIASWCYEELGELSLTVRRDGTDVVLNGVKRPVESALQAHYFLVTGSDLTQVLVPAATAGVSVQPMTSVDLTRRYGVVRFDDVRLPADAVIASEDPAGAAQHQLRIAVVLSVAETVGALQAAFDMTVAWTHDRYSFGRPLASYQALKHRFADMKMWLEASHAISDAAVAAVQRGAPDAPMLASAAKAYVGHYGAELLQECVQLHGGLGVTFEHDIHLFLRRGTANRALYGAPGEHRQRLAGYVADGAA